MSGGYDDQVDNAWVGDDLNDPGDWDDGFGRGWTAAQNAAPPCCLHGEDCPLRRPEPRWRGVLRRWFGARR